MRSGRCRQSPAFPWRARSRPLGDTAEICHDRQRRGVAAVNRHPRTGLLEAISCSRRPAEDGEASLADILECDRFVRKPFRRYGEACGPQRVTQFAAARHTSSPVHLQSVPPPDARPEPLLPTVPATTAAFRASHDRSAAQWEPRSTTSSTGSSPATPGFPISHPGRVPSIHPTASVGATFQCRATRCPTHGVPCGSSGNRSSSRLSARCTLPSRNLAARRSHSRSNRSSG